MDVDHDLRELGYDPDEVGRKFDAIAQKALRRQFFKMELLKEEDERFRKLLELLEQDDGKQGE